jgi:hypothetical protein
MFLQEEKIRIDGYCCPYYTPLQAEIQLTSATCVSGFLLLKNTYTVRRSTCWVSKPDRGEHGDEFERAPHCVFVYLALTG